MFEIVYFKMFFYAFISILLCMCFHECSHQIAAMLCGKSLSFQFEYGKLFDFIYIPRFVWYMPSGLTKIQQQLIASAGFIGEFAMGGLYLAVFRSFGYCYIVVALIHILLYKFYAGEKSDFKWFV